MAMLPPPQAINPMNAMGPDVEQGEMGPDENEGLDQGGGDMFNVAQSSILLAQLAVQLRTLQFNAHSFHNAVSGPAFLANHAYLGELYLKYESQADDVTERIIGTGPKPNLVMILQKAVQQLQEPPESAEEMFAVLLQGEQQVQQIAEQFQGQCSQGVMNMVAGISDESEQHCYRFKQILGGQDAAPSRQ